MQAENLERAELMAPEPCPTIKRDQRIRNRYVAKKKLGQGGMGALYRCMDLERKELVAMRVLANSVAWDMDTFEQLMGRVQKTYELDHPCLVRSLDLDADGEVVFLATEFVDGPSYADLLVSSAEGKLRVEEVVKAGVHFLEALSYAHQQGVIHRDLRPGSLLRDRDGTVRLADLAAGDAAREAMARASEEAPGNTPIYMAPEQLWGRDLDPLSDIYQAGVTLYELLAGHPPFYDGDVVSQVLHQKPEPIAGIPEGLMKLIDRSLAKEPADRFPDAGSFSKALQEFAWNTGIEISLPVGGAVEIVPPPEEEAPTQRIPAGYSDVTASKWPIWLAAGAGAAVVTAAVCLMTFSPGFRQFFIGGEGKIAEENAVLPDAGGEAEQQAYRLTQEVKHRAEVNAKARVAVIDQYLEQFPDGAHSEELRDQKTLWITYASQGPVVELYNGHTLFYVPEGEFIMGQNSTRKPHESPQHTVHLGGFWLDRLEVTNEQFAGFLREMGHLSEDGHQYISLNDKASKITIRSGDYVTEPGLETRPVEMVTWHGADAYCNWLSCRTGREVRLPTEAQWEKACRGPSGRIYPWGDTWEGSRCNTKSRGPGHAVRVGSTLSGVSPYGILDMAGNVWEWCQDWYAEDYYASSPASDPTGPETGSIKAMRGGGWDSIYEKCRCAGRTGEPPDLARQGVGFRCVLN